MISYNPEKRPDLDDILKKSFYWSVERNFVSHMKELEAPINSLKDFENPFFYNYILERCNISINNFLLLAYKISKCI